MLSIFTPSHDTSKLVRAIDSVLPQLDGIDGEWLIALNGEARDFTVAHPKVRVVTAPEELNGRVGALKRFACEQAKGDILLELDHDDELLPGCIEKLLNLMPKGMGFFYSATDERRADGTPVIYGKDFGWRHREHGGVQYNVPFLPSARSLAEIFYTPNHVRAWTREAYDKAGGHDAQMEVCDDQDLICRTYLAGAAFALHDTPLYRQHMHESNTQKARNALIQKTQVKVRDKYLERLALEWSKRNGFAALDLGGAHGCPPGYTPVDMHPSRGIRWNVAENGIPAKERTVGVIRAHDFLEHIPIGKVVPLMNDIHRALAHGGFLLSNTPSTDGRGAFCDPTHCSFWNQLSFRYYTQKKFAAYVPEIECRFQAVVVETSFPSPWHKEQDLPYVRATLCANHGDRLAGVTQI